MVIGRGRRRKHPNQHCLLLLRVLQNFRLCMRTPKITPKESSDLRSHPVAMLLLLRKTRGKKRGHEQNLLPVRATSGQGHFRSRDFRSKGPTRADMAQLPVAHMQNILPDRARDWRHIRYVTNVTSGHMTDVTSGHVTSGSTTSNMAWAVPIYYWGGIRENGIFWVGNSGYNFSGMNFLCWIHLSYP